MAKITKLRYDAFNGVHPNGINQGFQIELDIQIEKPIVGESYRFGRLTTSYVTEILEDSNDQVTFKTKNSTYVVES